jgi:hypothetical protein
MKALSKIELKEIPEKHKDDFNLFEELDAAYREDFLGERKGSGTTEGKFAIKSTFEAVMVIVGLLIYLALDLMIMIFIMQVTGLDKLADFIGSSVSAFGNIPVQIFTMIIGSN